MNFLPFVFKKNFAKNNNRIFYGLPCSGKTSQLMEILKKNNENTSIKKQLTLCFSHRHYCQLQEVADQKNIISTLRGFLWQNYKLEINPSSVRCIWRSESMLLLDFIAKKMSFDLDSEKLWEMRWEFCFTENKVEVFDENFCQLMNQYLQLLKKKNLIDEALLIKDNIDLIPALSKTIDFLAVDEYEEASYYEKLFLSRLFAEVEGVFACNFDGSLMNWKHPSSDFDLKKEQKHLKIFKKDYLKTHYFSSNKNASCAFKLLRKNKNRALKNVKVGSKSKAKPKLYCCQDFQTMIAELDRLLAAEVDNEREKIERISILVRTHEQAISLFENLNNQLPVWYYGAPTLREKCQDVICFLNVLIEIGTTEDLRRMFFKHFSGEVIQDLLTIIEQNNLEMGDVLQFSLLQTELNTLEKIFIDKIDEGVWQIVWGDSKNRLPLIIYENNHQLVSEDSVIWHHLINEKEKYHWIAENSFFDMIENDYGSFWSKQRLNSKNIMEQNQKIRTFLGHLKDNPIDQWIAYISECRKKLNEINSFDELNVLLEQWSFSMKPQEYFFLKRLFQNHYQIHLDFIENLKFFLLGLRRHRPAFGFQSKYILLMTMHEARHHYWDTVFIPFFNQGAFPHYHSIASSDVDAERRILANIFFKSQNVCLFASDGVKKISQFAQESGLL